MRPFFVRFNRSESFVHTRSSAGFTIITSGFEFSVHTGGEGAERPRRRAGEVAQGSQRPVAGGRLVWHCPRVGAAIGSDPQFPGGRRRRRPSADLGARFGRNREVSEATQTDAGG